MRDSAMTVINSSPLWFFVGLISCSGQARKQELAPENLRWFMEKGKKKASFLLALTNNGGVVTSITGIGGFNVGNVSGEIKLSIDGKKVRIPLEGWCDSYEAWTTAGICVKIRTGTNSFVHNVMLH